MTKDETAALIRDGVERYDTEISGSDSYARFYNLSSLRTAALAWLPFDGTETVLDAGCGYGALTGFLCDHAARVDAVDADPACTAAVKKRYANRTDLRVFTADLTDGLPQETYDVILLLEVLEWYHGPLAALFAALRARLAPGGRLLVGFRSRYALRYACGLTDELVTTPGAAFDPAVPLHTKKEVETALAAAGLAVRRTYYPLPDLVFTQAVYSDAWLPQGSIRDRLLTYDPFGDGSAVRAAREAAAWDTASREGRLPDVANCILLDCTAEEDAAADGARRLARIPDGRTDTAGGKEMPVHGQDCLPAGAVLSADREAAHAFLTVFYDDETVEKRAVHSEGTQTLRALYENLETLRGRGLCAVEQQWVRQRPGDGTAAGMPAIRMPFMHHQPLLEHIRDLAQSGSAALTALFDALYAQVLQSADQTENAPTAALSSCPGPVLETGYIDMIPYNAFWTGTGSGVPSEEPAGPQNGGFLWYDQEFTVKNCPAAYVLYRAIRYTWLHLPELEAVLPLETVKAHYGLTACWDACTAFEDAFTERNRNRARYAQLYRWAWGAPQENDAARTVNQAPQPPQDHARPRPESGADLPQQAASCTAGTKPYRTGFVMGTFDLFHTGHLNLLQRAKERCEVLRVGVLSDELVRKYKHITPHIPLADRLAVVQAVRYVDEAVPVEGDFVSKIAEWYRRPYDCFFSGDDYADNEYWKQEKRELEALGATIEFFPYTEGISSTKIRAGLSGTGNPGTPDGQEGSR